MPLTRTRYVPDAKRSDHLRVEVIPLGRKLGI
jgi:hypothetical protein